jgi:hypothetical protein
MSDVGFAADHLPSKPQAICPPFKIVHLPPILQTDYFGTFGKSVNRSSGRVETDHGDSARQRKGYSLNK